MEKSLIKKERAKKRNNTMLKALDINLMTNLNPNTDEKKSQINIIKFSIDIRSIVVQMYITLS